MTVHVKYGLLGFLAIVCIFWILQPRSPQEENSGELALVVTTAFAEENAETFRRIFWKQPSDADRIIASQRREHAAEPGSPNQWDWFIAVEASTDLTKYLIEENPFQLSKTINEISLDGVPNWFPKNFKNFDFYKNPTGEMIVLVDLNVSRLYVWKQARAFQKTVGLPVPESTTTTNQNSGRLPNTSPSL